MLDLNLVNSRYYPVKIKKYVLELEPCKLKTFRKFQKLNNGSDDEDILNIFKEVLDKNKTHFKVPMKVIEELTIDQMNELLLGYFNWVAEEKSNNPN